MRSFVLFILIFSLGIPASAQISAKLMRFPALSDSHIAFVYGGDIWVVDKAGGIAQQVTSSPGEESWPKFSPDGSKIGFTAAYDGNNDVYVMPVLGGVPTRVTYPSFSDRMIAWHPDGEHILFASNREAGIGRLNQFYLVGEAGGMPEKLDIPYGELASFSPDGSKLAYITKITENYPFKRYRGGLTSDILIYDFNTGSVERITEHHANDGKPAWVGDVVYFLSDRGKEVRRNIWAYDTNSKEMRQVTDFKDFDISFMSRGNGELIFEMGGQIYIMDASDESYDAVEIQIISDLAAEMPRAVDLGRRVEDMSASPGGTRVVFSARGELFSVPVENGATINLTRSSGANDRNPAWSPNGRHIAYWSDKSGENELYIKRSDSGEETQLTERGKGFGYQPHWSPDSKHIAFIDEKNDISVVDVASGDARVVANTMWNVGHGGRFGFSLEWSPDSKWIAFARGLENANGAVFLYSMESGEVTQATSGFYNDSDPVFSEDGKYLFYLTDRSLSAMYSDMGDGTWIYPNATQIASVSLNGEAPSLLEPRNDEVEIIEDESDDEEDEEDEGEDDEEDGEEAEDEDAGDEDSDEEEDAEDDEDSDDDEADDEGDDDKAVEVVFEDFESRIVLLPIPAGNIGGLMPFKGKLVFLRYPNSGSENRSSSLRVYDFEKREDKEVISDVSRVAVTADGKKLLVRSKGKYGVIDPAPRQKIEDAISTSDMSMNLIPREEWRQIFNDTWRRHRDFFYDPGMHGVDWDGLREQYGELIEDARTRWDVTNIQSDLAAELSAGHTYTGGGDVEGIDRRMTGYLGIDWDLDDTGYSIKRIIRPAVWDTEVRSPFDRPGVEVKAGDRIIAVNGIELETDKDPYAAFDGMSGRTVGLTVQKADAEEPEEVIVKLLTQGEEYRLRYLEWIENNRKMVEELSDGKLGYIYMSNTSSRGQLELVRMFYGQLDKQGFIIDERFNGGGQLADRFLELMKRPVVYNLHWRHGKDHTWPLKTNTGPMGMLINGWAGSGGDGLPWAFQELEAGPVVGERTVGILVGPATGHRLIDGGRITVPGCASI